MSFARTILHKPSVMILDEATANIDTETEKIIQESLEKVIKNNTMLMVAMGALRAASPLRQNYVMPLLCYGSA